MRKWIALYLIIALSISSCSAQDTGRLNSDLSLESSMELEQSHIPEISNGTKMLEAIQPTQDGNISIPSNYDPENYIIPFDNPDLITVYTTYPYYFNLYMPVPKHTSGMVSNEEFLRLTLSFNGEYEWFENAAIYIEEDTAIIRPSAKRTLFDSDKASFDTMAKTLLENISRLEKVIIEADVNEVYKPSDLEDFQNPLPTPFPVAKHTYEELAVLRSEIPFTPTDYNIRHPGMLYPNVKDETDLTLTNFLQSIGLSDQYSHYNQELSYPNIVSQNDLAKETILYAAIMNAPRIIWNKDNLSMYQGSYFDEEIHCYEQLSVLEQYCNDNSGVLMEHVEMAAKYIFGENVSLEHEALRGKAWHLMEFAGIYVPAHVGGGNSVEPIILERHDFVDYYELVVAFGTRTWGLDAFEDKNEQIISDENILSYYIENGPKAKIVVEKASDEHFILKSWQSI